MKIKLYFTILLLAVIFQINCGGMGSDSASSPNSLSTSRTGKGGSTARFTIVDNFLYTLSGGDIQLFNIETPSDPMIWNKVSISSDIETIFPYENKLFIGSETGVYIYDNDDPANPDLLSKFLHVTSCDPVVVNNSKAYVTLRDNIFCQGNTNQLDIIDITDARYPLLIKTYAMQGPYGLGIDNDKLFICDGGAGLKVFNAADSTNLILLDQIDTLNCSDVIPSNNLLIVTGETGISQYDYSETPLTLLSTLQVSESLAEGI